MRLRCRILALLLTVVLVSSCAGRVYGQAQMLLPYHDRLFQATWVNPAARPTKRFSIGLPVLSSVEAGVVNNGFTLYGISSFEDTVLYINAPKLEKSLFRNNHIYGEFETDLLHFRMAWQEYYFWIGLRARAVVSILYNRDLVSLVTGGNKRFVGKPMQLSRMALDARIYQELTFGASRMEEDMAYGGRVSFLAGVAAAHSDISNFTLTVDDNSGDLFAHHLLAKGRLYTSSFPKDQDGYPDLGRFDDADYLKSRNWFNFKNPGLALAGGFSYRLLDDLELSASLTDVGLIYWSDSLSTYKAKQDEAVVDVLVDDIHQVLETRTFSFDSLTNKLSNMAVLDSTKLRKGEPFLTWLSPKVYLMARYKLWEQSTVGASFSGTLNQRYFYPALTLSFQQDYSDWLSVQATWSYNQRSFLNFGLAVLVTPSPIQFYVITDNLLAFMAPTISRATNARVGLNIAFDSFSLFHSISENSSRRNASRCPAYGNIYQPSYKR